MGCKRKFIDACCLTTEIKDANLGIWNTAAISGFGVGLIFAVAIATSRTCVYEYRLDMSK